MKAGNKNWRSKIDGGISKEVDPLQEEWSVSYWALLKEEYSYFGQRILHERTISDIIYKVKKAKKV